MLRPRETSQRSFFDASFLVGDQACFEFARFYAREILPLVTDRDFEELYSKSRGRPAVSPSLLFHVSVLATLEGLSDRKAAHAIRVRLDWQLALGQRIDVPAFDRTRLVEFRSRFLGRDSTNDHDDATEEEKKRARLLFDRIVEKLMQVGLIKKGQSVRLDSTHINSAAKNINRYQTIFEAMKLAVRAVDEADLGVLDREELKDLREKYSTPMGAYDLKRDRVRKNLEISVKDAVRLLNVLDRRECRALRKKDALGVLAKAVKDNVELRRKGAKKRKKGRPPKGTSTSALTDEEVAGVGQIGGMTEDEVEVVERQSGDRMITPHDRSARLGVKKGGKLRWSGHKLHATETVPDKRGRPSFIVDGEMTPANATDESQTLPTLDRLNAKGLEPEQLLADAGYVHGATIARSKSEHGTVLVGPPAQPRATGLIPVEKFSVDFDKGVAMCPAGKKSDTFKLKLDGERLTGADARFRKATCAGCALAAKCLGKGKTARTASFTPYHADLVAQREWARTPEFKAEYKKRAPGEGIFAELTGALGMRRSNYKGKLKTYYEHMLGLAAINVKRLQKALSREPQVVPAPV
jgi:transposase